MSAFELPPELWLEIFSWTSTFSSARYSIDYTPFQLVLSDSPQLLELRSILVRVCRYWRALATDLLYQDLRIKHGQLALKEVLCTDSRVRDQVRRVTLPFPATTTTPKARECTVPLQILNLCSNAEVLIRPQCLQKDTRFEFDTACPTLPSIKRIEWWQHSEAERSGGINSLSAVIRSAPGLTYLLLSSNTGLGFIGLDPRPLNLPALTTLRLLSVNAILISQIAHRWSMASLTHVIIDNPLVSAEQLHDFWSVFGHQLVIVEFGRHLRFLLNDYITGHSNCLELCPNLQQLNYHILFTVPPNQFTGTHTSLHSIGLHFMKNDLIATHAATWKIVQAHLDHFLSDSFPALRTIRLYGDWQATVDTARLASLQEVFERRGGTIQSYN